MSIERIVIIAERDFAEVGNHQIEKHLERLRGIEQDSAHVVCQELAPALLAAADGLREYMDDLLNMSGLASAQDLVDETVGIKQEAGKLP